MFIQRTGSKLNNITGIWQSVSIFSFLQIFNCPSPASSHHRQWHQAHISYSFLIWHVRRQLYHCIYSLLFIVTIYIATYIRVIVSIIKMYSFVFIRKLFFCFPLSPSNSPPLSAVCSVGSSYLDLQTAPPHYLHRIFTANIAFPFSFHTVHRYHPCRVILTKSLAKARPIPELPIVHYTSI